MSITVSDGTDKNNPSTVVVINTENSHSVHEIYGVPSISGIKKMIEAIKQQAREELSNCLKII